MAASSSSIRGTRGGSRVFGTRFDSSAAAASSDLPLLRPHGGIAASSLTSLKVADAVLRDHIFVHLDDNIDKFNLLIVMLQKLFSLVDQTSEPDNPDSLQNQEVLLPGHLITIYLKEKLQEWLLKAKRTLQDEVENKAKKFELSSLADVKKVLDRGSPKQIGAAIENMLKTGRLNTQSGLDLQQE